MLSHRMSGTPEYQAWKRMRNRCFNPNHARYKDYGGRGITVCPEWDSFDVFYAHVGPRPSPDHSLHRVENDDIYKPGNVVWATGIEQARATRNNNLIECRGRSLPIAEWAESIGIAQQTLTMRLRRGWTAEQALGFEEPPRRMIKRPEPQHVMRSKGGAEKVVQVSWKGETHYLVDLAKEYGLSYDVALRRLRLGWSIERIIERPIGPATKDLVTHPVTGESKSQAEWARHLGISKSVLSIRIKKGWPLERALTKDDGRETRERLTIVGSDGVERTRMEEASRLGISYDTLAKRIHRSQ